MKKFTAELIKRTLQGSIINTMLRDDYKVWSTRRP